MSSFCRLVIALLSGKLVDVQREGSGARLGGFLRNYYWGVSEEGQLQSLPRLVLPAGAIVLQGLSSLSLNFQACLAHPCACEPAQGPGSKASPSPSSSQHCRCPSPTLKPTIKGSLVVSTGTDHTQFNNWKCGRLKNSHLNLFQSRKLKICHQLVKISPF